MVTSASRRARASSTASSIAPASCGSMPRSSRSPCACGPRSPRSRTARAAASSRTEAIVQVVQHDLRRGRLRRQGRVAHHARATQPREFIVQYREIELELRLAAARGRRHLLLLPPHAAEGHTMILADDSGALRRRGRRAGGDLRAWPRAARPAPSRSQSSRARARCARASVHLRDYDFEKPQFDPGGVAAAPTRRGRCRTSSTRAASPRAAHGQRSRRRADARAARRRRHRPRARAARSACAAACPFDGRRRRRGLPERRVRGHRADRRAASRRRRAAGASNVACENRFRGIPKDAPFAPPRRARSPRIRGMQTAIVTGQRSRSRRSTSTSTAASRSASTGTASGQQDDTSSCWLRVVQVAHGRLDDPAARRLGGLGRLPRRRPRPAHRARPRSTTPRRRRPTRCPARKASGSLKSMSSPGGGGHNEINMGDSRRQPGLRHPRAEGSQHHRSATTRTRTVGGRRRAHVTVQRLEPVGVDESIDGRRQSVARRRRRALQKVAGSQSITVGGNDTQQRHRQLRREDRRQPLVLRRRQPDHDLQRHPRRR